MLLKFFFRTNWCTIHGTKYKKGAIVHTGYNGLMPQFAVIKQICTIHQRDLSNNIFFVLKDIVTLNYDSHTHSYRVRQINNGTQTVIKQSSLVTFRPMHICKPINMNGIECVCPKLDVDLYNEQ
jgi:hypothetical protein